MPPATHDRRFVEQDLLGAADRRLDTRPAQAVHGERRHLDRQAGTKADMPGTVVGVGAALLDVAEHDVIDGVGSHAGAGQRAARGDGAQLDRRHVLERADMLRHGRARAAENEEVVAHWSCVLRGQWARAAAAAATASPTAVVPSVPPMSVVVWPSATARSTARSMQRGLGGPADGLEQQRRRQDRAHRIGDVLPGQRRRRAVHRLEQRRAARMDVARRRHPQTALQRPADVGDDVAEQVVGDDDLELAGILDQEHRQGVDVEVRRGDARELR